MPSAWRAMTGTNQRETQVHIDGVVGLDYDTFTNSSFLLQGQSDAFTKRNPSERKEVLARILNLSRYDRLAERAGERAKAARKEADFLERERERLEGELAAVPRLEEEQAATARRKTELAAAVESSEADAQARVSQVEALRLRGAERDAVAQGPRGRPDPSRTRCRRPRRHRPQPPSCRRANRAGRASRA